MTPSQKSSINNNQRCIFGMVVATFISTSVIILDIKSPENKELVIETNDDTSKCTRLRQDCPSGPMEGIIDSLFNLV